MDSINQQQPDHRQENLEGAAAITRMKEIAENAETCFFCTSIKTGVPFSVRPMSVLQVDGEGNLWFMSSNDSDKNAEIAQDPFVHLLFQESKHSGFLNVYGMAETLYDKAKIDELWEPIIKVWFTEGKDDPRISLIKVSPTQGYYWDNVHGKAISFIKMAASLVIGKTLDDSVEGTLDME